MDDQEETGAAAEFRRQAKLPSTGVVGEFFLFLCDTKKWWLTPIILSLLLVSLLILFGGSAAAPFIYTLF